MMRLLTLLLLVFTSPLQAQQVVLTVLDQENDPLVRATVRFRCLEDDCRDSLVLRRTNISGTVQIPFNARTAISVEYAGHITHNDTLEQNQSTTVKLQRNSNDLIVVTGQYEPRSISESVYDLQVFDKQRIESQGATTLRDLMATELNVRLEQDMILGTGMSIQGISGQNVKILMDGIPVIGRLGGNIDLNQISLENIERVELIRGPLSVIYGTDALGGVVNLITDRRTSSGLNGKIQSYAESIGTVNVTGDLRYRHEMTTLAASLGRNFFAGYSEQDTSRAKEWKPREQHSATWEAQQWIDGLSLNYSGRYFWEFILNRGEPRLPYRETAFDDKYYTRRTSHTITLTSGPSVESNLEGVVGYSVYNRIKNTLFKDLVTLDEQLTTNPEDQDTTNILGWIIRSTYSNTLFDTSLSWQTGLDINLESISGKRIEGQTRSLGDYAIFGSIHYQILQDVIIQPSLRYAYNTNYPAPLTPSVNVLVKPDASLSIRMSYARGFRAPSLKDLYFYFVDISHNIQGNTNLRAEYSHSFNGDLKWQPLDNRSDLTLSFAFFHNTINDLITLAFIDGTLYSYVNVGQHRTIGGELEIEHSSPYFEAHAGFSLTGKRSALLETSPTTPYSIASELRGDIQWLILSIEIRLAAFYKYTGPQPSYVMNADGLLQEYTTSGYHTLDLSLSRSIETPGLTISGGIKNVFDVRNIESSAIANSTAHSSSHNSIPVSWGRTAYLDLKLALGK